MVDHQALVYWLRGYVLIKIKGKYIERLLNRMMIERFDLWNVVPLSDREVEVCLTTTDFFKLRPLLKETSCQMQIIKKIGLPFTLRQLGQNKGYYAGALIFVILLYLGSNFIWTVEIEGLSSPEQKKEVQELLADLGIAPFKLKQKAAPPDEVKRAVLGQFEEATWAGFEYEGTTARLKVVLKSLPEQPEAVPFGNLVAAKKAVVRDLLVESGTPLVKPHQLVRPGEVLVLGEIGSGETSKQVPAKGKVWGEVWYMGQISIPMEQKRTVLTGEVMDNYYLRLGPFQFKIWGFGQEPFASFSRFTEEHPLSVWSYKLPIAIVKEKLMESYQVTERLDKKEAEALGLRLAREKMRAQLDDEAEIVDENILKKEYDSGKVYIKIHYSVIEEISKRN